MYCRWAPAAWGAEWGIGRGGECLSLKEKSNYDCIFWNQGCTVYAARPVQCRTFPFWRSVVSAAETWEIAASGCPGIGSGPLYSREQIEARLAEREAEPVIERAAMGGM
jgi:Fe-S-cluster containining protein